MCYKAGAAVLSPLCSDGMERFLENVGTGFGLLLGMLSTCCMDFIPRTRVYGGDGETDMTELLQTILLRVTIAGAASAVALKLAGGGALKEVVRTAAGLLMLLALLQPLAGLHLLSWNWQSSALAGAT